MADDKPVLLDDHLIGHQPQDASPGLERRVGELVAHAVTERIQALRQPQFLLALRVLKVDLVAPGLQVAAMVFDLPPTLLQLFKRDRRSGPREKNGPALAGHGAEAVRDAIASMITSLPEQLRQSLTWDQGAEMSQHMQLKIDTGVALYFCDPHSPWQRGTNENTDGLPRRYFPKGNDLSLHSANDLAAVASTLNGRPRETLGWKTPAETFDALLRPDHTDVATTG